MTNAIAINKAPSKVDVFVGEVLPPDRMEIILASLPSHVKPERFQRNLVIAVTQHPKLLDCDPAAVFNEVSKAAALGLYLDPQLGEAYLITGWDSRNNRPAPQLRLGYRGLIKLARQSGMISTVYAHEVCRNDVLDISLGDEKKLVHKPDYFNDRGEVGLYYAVVHFSDGTSDFEPMSINDINRIRDRSDGWRAFKAGKIKSTPWASDPVEMSKKTVLRRLLKRIPQSPELADAIQIEDADYTEGPDTPARPSLSSRLTSGALPAPTGFSTAHVVRELGEAVDADTGEISDAKPAASNGQATPGGAEKENDQTNTGMTASKVAGPDSGQGGEEASPTRSEPEADPSPSPPIAKDGLGASSGNGATDQGGDAHPDVTATNYAYGDYARALARASQEKSLKSFDEQFRLKAAWTTEEDAKPTLRDIFVAHRKKLRGEMTPAAFLAELTKLVAAA